LKGGKPKVKKSSRLLHSKREESPVKNVKKIQKKRKKDDLGIKKKRNIRGRK